LADIIGIFPRKFGRLGKSYFLSIVEYLKCSTIDFLILLSRDDEV